MFSLPNTDPRPVSDIIYSFPKALSFFFSGMIRKSMYGKPVCKAVNDEKKEGKFIGRGEKRWSDFEPLLRVEWSDSMHRNDRG